MVAGAGATAARMAAAGADVSGKNSRGADASGRSEGSSGSTGALLLNRKALGLGENAVVVMNLTGQIRVSVLVLLSCHLTSHKHF